MPQSDNQSATHVVLLHGQETEDSNLSEVWSEKNHWKRNWKKKGVSKCTVLKSDPPALRTGNDKFRISFSCVQRSLSNRKPAEREREHKNKIKNVGDRRRQMIVQWSTCSLITSSFDMLVCNALNLFFLFSEHSETWDLLLSVWHGQIGGFLNGPIVYYTSEPTKRPSRPIHIQFDPGMVRKGVLVCCLTSLRNWSIWKQNSHSRQGWQCSIFLVGDRERNEYVSI